MVIRYSERPGMETPRGSIRAYKPSILSTVEEESPEGTSLYASVKDAGIEDIKVHMKDDSDELPYELPSTEPKSILKSSTGEAQNGPTLESNGVNIHGSGDSIHY